MWADSQSRIWVSEWRSGQVSMYDPKTKHWRAWKAPGNDPQVYAVYVDNKDIVWLSDFGANAVLCCTGTYECRVRRKRRSGRDYLNATINFDGIAEEFSKPSNSRNASVRQILGRTGEVWFPESGSDKLVVIRE